MRKWNMDVLCMPADIVAGILIIGFDSYVKIFSLFISLVLCMSEQFCYNKTPTKPERSFHFE